VVEKKKKKKEKGFHKASQGVGVRLVMSVGIKEKGRGGLDMGSGETDGCFLASGLNERRTGQIALM
jgi:hypothetical protein